MIFPLRGKSVTLAAACSLIAGATMSGCNKASGPHKKQIGVILMQEDQFFRLNELGMQDAAKKFGVDLLVNNANGKVDTEASLVDTYAARGVDAIIDSPIGPTSSAPTLEVAKNKGIKIFTYNAVLNKPIMTSAIKSDDVSLGATTGKVMANYIKTKMGGKANIAILEFLALSPEQGPLRPRGFKAEMKKLPGVKIVAEQDAWLPPKAESVTNDMLTAHPEINIIWAANEGGTVGATTAIKNAGKAGKVLVFGTDMSEQLGGFLLSKDNILQAVTGQKAYEMGFQIVKTAVDSLNGKKVPANVTFYGVLYSRDNPAAVTKFVEQARKLTQ
jgi:ABC-type sugar transport system substrate-binding protein